MKEVRTNTEARAFLLLILSLTLCLPVFARAQSDGSAPPPDPKPADVTAVPAEPSAATSSVQPASASVPAATRTASPAGDVRSNPTSTSSSGGGKPTPVLPSAPTVPENAPPAIGDLPSENVVPTDTVPLAPSDGNWFLWPVLAVLTLIPFGFLAAGLLKKQPKTKDEDESNRRCFDIKALLEEKLKELTDLRGMAEDKVKKIAKENLREAVQGTATGDALVRLHK